MQYILDFINQTCRIFRIDDSHGIDHSIKTLMWSLKISKDIKMTYRECQIIKIACLLHDMCDKKYMDEKKGVKRIRDFLVKLDLDKGMIERIVFIITTMSYSKVVKDGYPTFYDKSIEKCYHIVRNSDLLCSYDPERCIGYNVRCGGTRKSGILRMFEIFENRVLRLLKDRYIFDYAKEYAEKLHTDSLSSLEKYKIELKLEKD